MKNNEEMSWKSASIAWIVYASFFGLIGFAVYWTNSAYPLFALLLTPSFKTGDSEDKKTPKNQ